MQALTIAASLQVASLGPKQMLVQPEKTPLALSRQKSPTGLLFDFSL